MKKINITSLDVHLKKSEIELRNFIEEFNSKLKKDNPENYNKLCLKSCHYETAKAVIRAYYTHRKGLKAANLEEEQVNEKFLINNVAIGKMRGYSITQDETGKNRCSTIYRHLLKLEEAEILVKTFRGSNTSSLVVINPKILTLILPESVKKMLVTMFISQNKGIITAKDKSDIYKLYPTMSALCNPPKVASCNHIENLFRIINNNINIYKEKIVNNPIIQNPTTNKNTPVKLNELISKSINNSSLITLQEQKGRNQKECQNTINTEKLDKKIIPPAADSKNATESLVLLRFYIDLAIKFALKRLWSGYDYSENEILQIKNYVAKYFAPCVEGYYRNNNIYKKFFNEFSMRIQLSGDYIDRNPARFIPKATTYFNPTFKYGFVGTKTWYNTVMQQRKKNKDWYVNQYIISRLYQQYATAPSIENFNKTTQLLGKKKDKKYLELFLNCVENPDNYNSKYFSEFSKE